MIVENSVWDSLIDIQRYLENAFSRSGHEIEEPGMSQFNQPGWVNRVWTSDIYRRAHVDVVDARQKKGLWMMHCCIFPHIHNPAPIYGFDVVAGKNKITGCFHDFSSAGDTNHTMIKWFAEQTKGLEWKKERALPEWAQNIFSNNMIAAGNVHNDIELETIVQLTKITLDYYLKHVGNSNNTHENTSKFQNFYCFNQKRNPHTSKVMTSLGLEEEDVRIFIQDCLFPEIQ